MANKKQAFRDAFNADSSNDILNLDPNRRFDVKDDQGRLESLVANESIDANRGLARGFSQLQGISERRGEGTALAEATSASGARSDADAAQFERATRGQGLTDRQRKSATRRLGLSRSLNRARAAGGVRRSFEESAKSARGVAGGFADSLFGQRLSGETSIAQSGAVAKNARTNRKADKHAARVGTAATVAGAAMMFFSSEKLKDDHGHEKGLLNKLKNVRVNRWQYKGDDKTHVGPFSEEFNREFGIDTDRPDMISVIDALGVTLGAVKELDKKISHAR